MTTLKTLSTLALATAALTAIIASANAAPKLGFGQGGQVISCRFGTGCTLTPTKGDHDSDRDRDRDHDYDRDHGYEHGYDRDHDHWHWSRWYHREYPVEVTGYVPESCVYAYKFRTVYVPGVGLERSLVKVCEPL